MHRSRKHAALLSGALAILLVFSVSCGPGGEQSAEQPQGDAAPDTAAQQAAREDFNKTLEEYRAAETMEEKAQIWMDFLERHPDDDYTLGTIQYLANNYYVGEKDDPEAAITFAKEHLENIADESRKADGSSILLNLYAEAGDTEAISNLAAEMQATGDMSASRHQSVARAALEAGAYNLAVEHASEAADMATPENIKAENPDMPEDRVQSRADSIRGDALTTLGWAQANLERYDDALATFEQAADCVTFNYVGVPLSDINVYWAKTLLKKGDYEAAMARIAPDAIFQDANSANEVFKEAYLASGGSEGNYEKARAEWHARLAKPMPEDFTAYTYDGEPVDYSSAKGEVTLLAFFFPT
jgi:tetratricopeptide (TPR) repeat protein